MLVNPAPRNFPPQVLTWLCRYQQAVGLFADNPDVKVYFHGGIWHGKQGAKRLYIERFQKTFTHGHNGPRHGFLLDHPMYQDVVDISEDGKTAKGRFRCNMQAGLHESVWPKDLNAKFLKQWWEGALYENEYIKEGGIWKLQVLGSRPQWHAAFEKGMFHAYQNQVHPRPNNTNQNQHHPNSIRTLNFHKRL